MLKYLHSDIVLLTDKFVSSVTAMFNIQGYANVQINECLVGALNGAGQGVGDTGKCWVAPNILAVEQPIYRDTLLIL